MLNAVYVCLGLLILSGLWYKIWFLRNPKIAVPKGRNVVSPAYGKIVKITEINPDTRAQIDKGKGRIKIWLDDVLQKEGWLISIVMTPLDVHFQKAPIDGKIVSIKHTPGKHRNAMSKVDDPERHAENEHQEIVISGEEFKVKVIQIAGFLARRVIPLVKPENNVEKGQDIGLIRFGSQVTLIIPKLDVQVKEGDKVRVGETVIATY